MADEIQGVSDTPTVRLFEVLKDDIMVSLSEGVYPDPRTGRDYEATRSEVAHQGDQYDNLSRVLIAKYDDGELRDVFVEVEESERKAEVVPEPAPVGGGDSDTDKSIDIDAATAEELAAETSRLDLKVIGTGAGGNVLKQDHQKALRDYYASRPGA